MTFTSTILYPNYPHKNCNFNYYLNTHMPLIEELWVPLGAGFVAEYKYVISAVSHNDANAPAMPDATVHNVFYD
ncbi:uncharacterized protein BKCO1_2500051 [Diplodia corticola]|uniref:EthD domain-containing protein n=1 Tax=Diplodia corticola TaxID=236234 RepID=A0A1J9R0M8_9PEZI|nr:uncharacterized protein BKCO1_2500051 [Diplodia corticola]OJD34153.1 hypothetical protein BKCO1_2500051 [Diplodia corticola]